MNTKLKIACQKLGLEVKEMGGFLDVEYEYLPILIAPDQKRNTFSILAFVVNAQGNLDESQFDIGLEVTLNFHKDYFGKWNKGSPYFASYEYQVAPMAEIEPGWLKDKLDAFWEAFTFLQANLFILGDDTFFQDNK